MLPNQTVFPRAVPQRRREPVSARAVSGADYKTTPRDKLSRNLNEQNVIADKARAAQAREDWVEAAELWASYCDRFPDDPGGFVLGAETLQKLSRGDEAEAILARGLPSHAELIEPVGLESENAAR